MTRNGSRARDMTVRLGALTCLVAALTVVTLWPGLRAAAAESDDASASPSLAAREAELLGQYRELERSFLRLADLLDASDPRRAALLRSACERARGEQVADRIEAIVAELEAGRLLKAGAGQEDSLAQLRGLLDLLATAADDRRREGSKQQVREFVTRLTKAIARQRDIQGSTEAGGPEAELAERQRDLAADARSLAADLEAFSHRDRADAQGKGRQGEPGEKPGTQSADAEQPGDDVKSPRGGAGEQGAEPPSDQSIGGQSQESPDAESAGDDEAARARRTRQRLQAAERRMQAAEKQLEQARRREARAEQDKAVEELETARAELEEILRQMREDEVERLLVQLSARVRQMLKAERTVRAAVEELADGRQGSSDNDAEPPNGSAGGGRQRQLEAARLGREQAAIGQDARRALALVRDDGSAVAVPQALEQVRDDSDQAVSRLERGDVGGTTRGIVSDIVAGLEEMLAALEQAQRDQQARQDGRQAGGQDGRAGERPLVDAIAELKMLRSLQLRVNTRTIRFAQLLGDAAAVTERPELRSALERLADRQRQIERAARDIASGKMEP
jgi:hypothetical protein